MGQNNEAVKAFEKAIETDPNLTVVRSRLESVKSNLSSAGSDTMNSTGNSPGNNSSELLSGFLNILK
jgi:hypothetical protein